MSLILYKSRHPPCSLMIFCYFVNVFIQKIVGKCGYAFVYVCECRHPFSSHHNYETHGRGSELSKMSSVKPNPLSLVTLMYFVTSLPDGAACIHPWEHFHDVNQMRNQLVDKCQKEKRSRNTLHQDSQLKTKATSKSEQHDGASMYCRTNENSRTTARGGENTHT